MSRVLTPKDGYSIINAIVSQMSGKETISAIDSSSFVSTGETLIESGIENVTNTLGLVLGRTFAAVRPYNASLSLINAINSGVYTNRFRKISAYSKDAQPSGYFNTDLNTNFEMGYTNGQNISNDVANSTKSMWEQNTPVLLELNFGGSTTWQKSLTVYEDKLESALRNENEFAELMNVIITENGNDIEREKEAFNRMTLLNKIAATINYGSQSKGSTINLTKEYNDTYGTSYTSEELRTTYIDNFLRFFVTKFKTVSDYMTKSSVLYHVSPTKTVGGSSYSLLRHTPKQNQRLLLYSPLFIQSETWVFPTIFNDKYLKIENAEYVPYWQSIDEGAMINVTPATTNFTTGLQTTGDNVNKYIVGVLYDEDAIMTDYILEKSYTTPLEARKGYRNIWWTFAKNAINDPTENCVVFTMED